MDPQAAAAQTAEAAAAALHAATAAAAAAQETAAQRAATAELQAATAELQAASGTAAQEAAAAAQAATAAAQRTAAAQESLKAEVRQMVAAQLAQARSAPAPAPRAPKLPPPEIFTGASSERGNVDQWLFLVETYLTTNGFVDPKVQVATAAAYLRGPALAWWRNCVQTDTKPATLAEFGITLKANFQPINSIEAARDRLANMRQTGTVRSFATALRNAALEIPGIQDEEVTDRFIRGLKPATQREVRMRTPVSFAHAAEMAERFDSMMYHHSKRPTPFASAPGPQPMELGAVMHNRQPTNRGNWDRSAPPNHGSSNRTQLDRPKLTPELRQQLLRDGKCFYCRRTGHLAIRCPERRQNPPQH